MEKEIKVSVMCMAYNHADYIRDALEGFVSQKTNFAFEVIIHDDASTDGTADIIREYEEKYPEIIKPIYQTENQYSKGVDIDHTLMFPLTRGKYLAFCEGDDCWVDEHKLQKQFDFLESHPECNICTHRAVFADHGNGSCRVLPKQAMSRYYSTEELIILGGLFFATASVFARREVYGCMPECFSNKLFGDWQITIYGSIGGGCYCLQDVMAIYNNKRPGSYTEKNNKDRELRNQINEEAVRMLERIDEHYGFRYHEAIESRIRNYRYRICKYQGKTEELQREEYAEFRAVDRAAKMIRRA